MKGRAAAAVGSHFAWARDDIDVDHFQMRTDAVNVGFKETDKMSVPKMIGYVNRLAGVGNIIMGRFQDLSASKACFAAGRDLGMSTRGMFMRGDTSESGRRYKLSENQ